VLVLVLVLVIVIVIDSAACAFRKRTKLLGTTLTRHERWNAMTNETEAIRPALCWPRLTRRSGSSRHGTAREAGCPFETLVASVWAAPERLLSWAERAEQRGVRL